MSNKQESVAERDAKIVATWERLGGHVTETAVELKIDRGTVYNALRRTRQTKPIAGGQRNPERLERRPLPPAGEVRRYILTSAQNNTRVWDDFMDNLEALAIEYEAEILCSSFTYNVSSYGKLSVKRGTAKAREELWYDERVTPLLDASDRDIQLAPGLVFFGRMNILPTSAEPLLGLDSYGGRQSGIFPHAKVAMKSIASGRHEATKFQYSTGTVTKLNYIQKAAGLKAEFHHTYGALVAEVDSTGSWWVRQLVADREGTIHDLDVRVANGRVTRGNRVEAITWGDIHTAQVDPTVVQLAWGKGGIVDQLKPKQQFFHDVLDFQSRNHHDRNNPHRRYELWAFGHDSVHAELCGVVDFLAHTARKDCDSIIVDSNHDGALLKWLRETDWRDDPVNAEVYLELQREVLRAIREQDKKFHLLEFALRARGTPERMRFLREDESFIICKDSQGGIECGMHGHLGIDGVRNPTPRSFRRMGRKANTAHTHKAGIVDGVYTAGHCSNGRQAYARGPSSWSQSNILTYPNGKRAIFTIWRGKHRA